MYPVPRLFRRKEAEAPHIFPVHAKDEVESRKVLRRHLPAYLAGNIDPVMLGHGHRPRIGRLAHMPVADGCRIDLEGIFQPALGEHGAEDALGKRRAAYIAEANEENGYAMLVGHAIHIGDFAGDRKHCIREETFPHALRKELPRWKM